MLFIIRVSFIQLTINFDYLNLFISDNWQQPKILYVINEKLSFHTI